MGDCDLSAQYYFRCRQGVQDVLAAEFDDYQRDFFTPELGDAGQRLLRLHFDTATALNAAVWLAFQSRVKQPANISEFVDHVLRLELRRAAAKDLDDVELVATWPTEPGITFACEAGSSAFDVAHRFFERIYTQVHAAQRDVFGDNDLELLVVLPDTDERLLAWQNKSSTRITSVLPTPWAAWKIRRDRNAIHLKLAAEFDRAMKSVQTPMPVEARCPDRRPDWNRDTGKLSYNGEVVKRIKNLGQAKNVGGVLDAFQEECWPPRIDDPLPYPASADRTNRTVASLNKNLSGIRFSADGTGQGFRWEAVQP